MERLLSLGQEYLDELPEGDRGNWAAIAAEAKEALRAAQAREAEQKPQRTKPAGRKLPARNSFSQPPTTPACGRSQVITTDKHLSLKQKTKVFRTPRGAQSLSHALLAS